MPINKYFDALPVKPLPAVARRWKLAIQNGKVKGWSPFCRLQRERQGLVFQPAELVLVLKDGVSDAEVENAPWDANLNDWLISEQHVPAEDPAAEADRFGFALKDRFSPVEIRFGDGFFNAVLVHRLRREGFADASPTKEKLAAIYEPPPAEGDQASICAEMIDDVLTRCAEELKQLSHKGSEGEEILTGALAYYLDERFNITNSRLLGFK